MSWGRTKCRYCQTEGPLQLLQDGDLICQDMAACERLISTTPGDELAPPKVKETRT